MSPTHINQHATPVADKSGQTSNQTSNQTKYRVGICGATGYVGGELIRRLLDHPHMDIAYATSRQGNHQLISDVFPQLLGITSLTLTSHSVLHVAQDVDVLFLALPHRAAMDAVQELFDEEGQTLVSARIIDLSGDFRLHSATSYQQHYNKTHCCPHLMSHFVYGLSEWNQQAIQQAHYVANPGCFATAINLALAPLAHAQLLPKRVSVFAATGSTGSGATAVQGTHHPERNNNYKLYKVLTHQHTPEIEMLLKDLGSSTQVSFIPASAPMSHGIFATAHVYIDHPEQAAEVVKEAYQSSAFVRVRTQSPQVNWVKGSNYADISLFVGQGELVIACVIDNMVKGASGQAIQNLNLMLGFAEDCGLKQTFPHFP